MLAGVLLKSLIYFLCKINIRGYKYAENRGVFVSSCCVRVMLIPVIVHSVNMYCVFVFFVFS